MLRLRKPASSALLAPLTIHRGTRRREFEGGAQKGNGPNTARSGHVEEPGVAVRADLVGTRVTR